MGGILRAIWALVPFALRPAIKRLVYRRAMFMSQGGQDFWIWGEAFDEWPHGFFVDIGAFDGVHVSNTYLLEVRYGWRGICVEANPQRFAELRRNRKCVCLNVCLDRVEGEVEFALRDELGGIVGVGSESASRVADRTVRLPTKTLAGILRESNAPALIEYLSIDVEGAEERILGDFDFSAYRFKTITIERPSERLRGILAANGYRLIKELPDLDCLYIHESFFGTYLTNLYQFYARRRLVYLRRD